MKVAVIGPGFVRAGYIGNHVRAFHNVGVTCKLAAPGRDYQALQTAFSAPGVEGYQFRTEKGLPVWPGDWQLLRRLVNWSDLVHVYHTAFPICTLAAVVAKAYRKPLVVTTTDHVVRKDTLWRLNSHIAWLLADRVVAYTEEEKQWLVTVGVNAAKIVKVPLGINVVRLDSYSSTKNRRRSSDKQVQILFVGRKHPDKNLETLIRCIRVVCDKASQPVQCILVGRRQVEEYAQKLERLINDLGLEDVVYFVGEVPDGTSFLNYYVNADVFVDIALFGTFEVVVLEAMAFGLPVVVSERVGVAEVVAHEQCGLVVDPTDDEAVVHALLDLIKHPERRAQLARRSRKAVQERYSYISMVRDLKSIYEDVLAHV